MAPADRFQQSTADYRERSRSRSRSPHVKSFQKTPEVFKQKESFNADLDKKLYRNCRFCDRYAKCEFGREECFCSDACYWASSKGMEALDWDSSEAHRWLLQAEGLARWRNQIQRFADSGKTLLTMLTEGTLRRMGVPRPKAKAVMTDLEDLRQGAWAQPEPPVEELPLTTVYEAGRHIHFGWKPVLEDPAHRSYAALCRNAIRSDVAWEWFNWLKTNLPWQDLSDERYQEEGKKIPRRTIFTVLPGCNCVYKYSGVKVPPTVEPEFVANIRRACVAMAGLQEQPNSCNINLYRDGHDSVGWHTDDEELFEGAYNDACILSLSLGATRSFQIKRQPGAGSAPGAGKKGPALSTITVAHGDLCTMEGRFQRYYLHSVPKEPHVKEPRINLTWRWITKHNQVDGCKICGAGNMRL